MKANSQSRKYHIVLCNPVSYGFTREKILQELHSLTLDYFCLADEISESGTYHTHIYAYSSSPIRFSTINRRFPTAHIEKAINSTQANRSYIAKTGDWANSDKSQTSIPGSFYESGIPPTESQEKAPTMVQLLENIKDGMSISEILDKYPQFCFRIKNIEELRQRYLSEKYMNENRKVKVHYIFGNTGTGKTRSIYAKHHPSDICRITTYRDEKIYFDSYMSSDVLCLEEFRSQIPITDMLNYLDIYPIMLPARYYDRVACYTTVYIISNISLYEQYTYVQANENVTWQAFLRRIDTVTEFLDDGTRKEYSKEAKFLW